MRWRKERGKERGGKKIGWGGEGRGRERGVFHSTIKCDLHLLPPQLHQTGPEITQLRAELGQAQANYISLSARVRELDEKSNLLTKKLIEEKERSETFCQKLQHSHSVNVELEAEVTQLREDKSMFEHKTRGKTPQGPGMAFQRRIEIRLTEALGDVKKLEMVSFCSFGSRLLLCFCARQLWRSL